MQPLNVREILAFMKKHPPQAKLTAEKVFSFLMKIDELIVDNAKNFLVYQAEMKARPSGEYYSPRHFKYRRLLSNTVNKIERNMVRLMKKVDPRKFTDSTGISKVKKLIANCQINLGNESVPN